MSATRGLHVYKKSREYFCKKYICQQYSVARTPQVGKSKLQITHEEKNHKWPKAMRDIFSSQVICNFDFPTHEVPATILYDCTIINHKN